MISRFQIAVPKSIIFGRGEARRQIAVIASHGRKLMLVHGSNGDRAAWLISELQSAGCDVHTVGCSNEPDLTIVESAVADCRARSIDAVVAIGGGAVIDLGKAIAGLVRNSGSVPDYLEIVGAGKPLDASPLPFIALPTTSGTGAEVTKNAVITIPEHRRKVSLRDNAMLADLVIVDPSLTDGCPGHVTLASGLDAITQLIEPYISCKANSFTDGLVSSALPAALTAIQELMKVESESARDAMSWASLASGMALANSGLGVVHGLAGVIGGMTGAAHGEICAALLAASLTVNRREAEIQAASIARLDEINAMLMANFGAQHGQTGFEKLDGFIRRNGIRPIDVLGLAQSDFDTVAKQAEGSSSMRGNPISLTEAQLVEILALSSAAQ